MKEDKNLPRYPGATRLVFGEGNPDTEIYFLGEAPGFYEDRLGRPFVGQAGKLLDRLLEQIGLRRESVYISNVVRYRPPNNRDPNPDEILAFQKYVDEEIKIIKPKIIVTLGRFALDKFLPGEYISRVHGKPRRITWQSLNVTIIPMYHPAAALRNSDFMRQLIADFKVIKNVLEEIQDKQSLPKQSEDKAGQMNLI